MYRNTGPLTHKQRAALRPKILSFCLRKPRTHREVSDKFQISGISAAAFLTSMRELEYDPKTKKYGKVPF